MTLREIWREISTRIPWVFYKRAPWAREGDVVFRIFGFKPYQRLCLLDYTKASFYEEQPPWVRLKVAGVTLWERNEHLSGLPRK